MIDPVRGVLSFLFFSSFLCQKKVTHVQLHVLALPEEAVAIDNGLHYIFIKEEEHEDETHFMKIPVLKLASDFGYVQIDPLEALEDNTEIVTYGAYFLMAQSKKGEEGAGGHHH